MGNLPAQDVENIVLQAVKQLLLDKEKISWLGKNPDEKQHLIAKSQQGLQTMKGAEPGDIYKLLRGIIGRVVIHDRQVDVQMLMEALKQYLLDGQAPLEPTRTAEGKTITIEMKVSLRRFRKALRIVADQDAYGNAIPQPNPAICKALARAFVWNEKLQKGEVQSFKQIQREEGIDDQYVNNMVRLAYLSPDIITALLLGEYPSITINQLIKISNHNWQAQKNLITKSLSFAKAQ